MLSMLSTKVILSAKYCNSQLKMTTIWTMVFKWRKYKKQNVHCLCMLLISFMSWHMAFTRLLAVLLFPPLIVQWAWKHRLCSERGRRRNVLSPVLSLVLFSAHPTLSLATWSVEGIKRDCSQSRFIEDAVTQSISFLLSIVQNTLTLTAQVSFMWPTPPCTSWIRVSLLPMATVALVASLAAVKDRGACYISSLVWAPSG